MDWQLRGGPPFPADPKLELRILPDMDSSATVLPDNARHVERVDVYYVLGEKPSPNRFWRHVSTTRTANAWKARLPILKSNEKFQAFANVRYQAGVCLSTTWAAGCRPPVLGASRWRVSSGRRRHPSKGTRPGCPSFSLARVRIRFSDAPFRARRIAGMRTLCASIPPSSASTFRSVLLVITSATRVTPAGREFRWLSRSGEFHCRRVLSNARRLEKAEIPSTGLTIEVTSHDWTPLARHYTAAH